MTRPVLRLIADHLTPALAAAAGLTGLGAPVPGETVCVKLRAGPFGAVVGRRRGQGPVPVKLPGFPVDLANGAWDARSGVNTPLGLPVIRSPVDHRPAFAIAGRGIARARSLIETIAGAERLASQGTPA